MDVDGPRPAVEPVAPDLAEEVGAREHPVGAFGEEPQERELLVREVERRAVDARLEGHRVEDERPEADRPRFGPADATGEEREAQIDLGGWRAAVHDVVRELGPRERGDGAPFEDDDDGDLRVAVADRDEDGVRAGGELARIEEHRRGPGPERRVEGLGGERVDLHLAAGEAGEGLVGGPVGEEDERSHRAMVARCPA